jgi:hypothetical protein
LLRLAGAQRICSSDSGCSSGFQAFLPCRMHWNVFRTSAVLTC